VATNRLNVRSSAGKETIDGAPFVARSKKFTCFVIDVIEFKGYFSRLINVVASKRIYQSFLLIECNIFGIRNTDTPKVLRLKSEIPPAHSNAIAFHKELSNRREQKTAKDFHVPVIGMNEIDVVVRIGFARVKKWDELVLDIRDVEFWPGSKPVVNPIDRSEPGIRIFLSYVAPN